MGHDLGKLQDIGNAVCLSDSLFYVALTGGIGSGKSTVADWLAQEGARVFDADAVVHMILQTPEAVQWARELWGDICLKNKGPGLSRLELDTTRSELDITRFELDRKSVAQIIFNDPQARRDWESFIHPRIGLCLDRWLNNLEPDPQNPLVVFDIPLFFETSWGEGQPIDEIWVVYAPRDQRIERLVKRRGMKRDDIEVRIAAQMSLEEKARLADVVIDNSTDWTKTVGQLKDILARVRAQMESRVYKENNE